MAIGVGIVGLGFISQMHQAAYAAAKGAKLVALCDSDAGQLANVGKGVAGNIDAGDIGIDYDKVAKYTSLDKMLADPNVDAVSICTPTHTHVPLALKAIAAGKHVLTEKPISVKAADAKPLVAAARKTKLTVMVAQCIRFWPEYVYLKDVIEKGTLGKLRSLTMTRLSPTPTWSHKGWILEAAKSGSAAMDLHVHDTDFVCYAIGKPKSVVSVGTSRVTPGVDHIMTMYRFADKKLQVAAEGGWGYDPDFAFRMQYHALFENGSIDFTMAEFHVFKNGKELKPKLAKGDGYQREVQYFIDCVRKGVKPATATPADAMQSVAVVEAELASCKAGKEIKV
jgi:predicted dehydrogenase